MREIIGNTTATPNPRPDWNQTDETKADFIKNKPDLTLYATTEWVKKYVSFMSSTQYTTEQNESGGITYNITTANYATEENDGDDIAITI